MNHEQSYYLTGKKYLFSFNIVNYDNEKDRDGAYNDEQNIIDTLKE